MRLFLVKELRGIERYYVVEGAGCIYLFGCLSALIEEKESFDELPVREKSS